MTPRFHPDADDLVEYASGASPEWVSLLVACHLTYCPECRREVESLEDVGGVLLDVVGLPQGDLPPLAAPADLAGSPGPGPAERSPTSAPVPGLPVPLQPYLEQRDFSFFAPGVRQIPLSLSAAGMKIRVVRFKAGFTVPRHAHREREMVLVLDGVLEDTENRDVFRTGDVSVREGGSVHAQHVPSDAGPCTCLVVSTAQVTPTSLWGRFLQALTGV